MHLVAQVVLVPHLHDKILTRERSYENPWVIRKRFLFTLISAFRTGHNHLLPATLMGVVELSETAGVRELYARLPPQ